MENKFLFFRWLYHPIKNFDLSRFDDILDCGVNLPMSPTFNYKDPDDVAKLKEMLDHVQARGIKMILSSGFSTGDYHRMGEELWCSEFKKFYDETLERHPAVYGFCVGDEPGDKYWLGLTKTVIIKMKEIHPNLTPYINFAGRSGPHFGSAELGDMTLAEWLRDLKDQAGDFLHTYDQYSQVINNEGGTSIYFDECIKNVGASEAAGIIPIACLICSAHWVFRPVQPVYGINWQISTAAACGFKGVNWFRLCDSHNDPNYHASPIDAFGNKTELYYDVLRAQKTFSMHYGDIFPHLKRKSTFFFGEDKKRGSYPRFDENSHEIIKNVTCSWEESMISFFEHDETGEEYFCVVNLSRQHYEHYNFYGDKNKYSVYRVLENGKRQSRVPLFADGEEFENLYLYPGQLELFRIEKK
ncbi:MAG: hypothetical protein IKM46_08380 [Clostridia bacterium]|nr:hypothetical protein [Clostridia bacterium]